MNRGEVFYIKNDLTEPVGSEMRTGRPAIIVSSDIINHASGVVEVVFLTTQEKTPLATHAKIHSTLRPSTALCEQVDSVSRLRIGDYLCSLTLEEMEDVDRALAISFSLAKTDGCRADYRKLEQESVKLRAERDCYKDIVKNILAKDGSDDRT